MRYSFLFFTLSLFSLTLLHCSAEDTRSHQWHEIWQKKGQKAQEKHQSLYEADGYEVMSEENWQAMVKRLLIKADAQKAQTVCEFGCGAGALLEVAQNLNSDLKIYGFDYTSSLVDLAQARFAQGHFWVQSVADSLPDEISKLSFDATICSGVFIYVNSQEDVLKTLQNMLSITKDGGKIILGDISDLDKKELAMKIRGETHSNQTTKVAPGLALDHLYLPREMFRKFANDHNLDIEFVEYPEIDPSLTYPNGQYRYCLIMTKKTKA